MSRKYAPPFATLALVQSAGGAYTQDATFSLVIIPSLSREMWMLASSLCCHSTGHGDLEPDCVGVLTRGSYVRDQNTSARLRAKMQGGLTCKGGLTGEGGRICGTLR